MRKDVVNKLDGIINWATEYQCNPLLDIDSEEFNMVVDWHIAELEKAYKEGCEHGSKCC